MKRYPTTATATPFCASSEVCVRVGIGTTRHFAKKSGRLFGRNNPPPSTFLIRSGSQEYRDALSKFPLSFLVPRITSRKKKRSHHPLFCRIPFKGKKGGGVLFIGPFAVDACAIVLFNFQFPHPPFPPPSNGCCVLPTTVRCARSSLRGKTT